MNNTYNGKLATDIVANDMSANLINRVLTGQITGPDALIAASKVNTFFMTKTMPEENVREMIELAKALTPKLLEAFSDYELESDHIYSMGELCFIFSMLTEVLLEEGR